VSAFGAIELDASAKILAARQSEWHAGARTGVSDQTPMVLARRGAMLNGALLAEDLDLSGIRHVSFPAALRVLVIDSRTQRSLSGGDQVAYTKNRFAYSAALHLLRHACREAGIADADTLDRLSRITPERFGGSIELYRLLQKIPQQVTLEELRGRYGLADIESVHASFFGHLPQEQQPLRFEMRGPLLFGLAESERARLFPDAIESSDFARAGRLMTTGHNGDRRVHPEGGPYDAPADDALLGRLVRSKVPIDRVPGAYGASSPALDGIVDAARAAGALGACLTGGGIAGSVLALCRAEDSQTVADSLRGYLASSRYAERRPGPAPLSATEAHAAVVENHSAGGAGEIAGVQ
jgi:galactokinase